MLKVGITGGIASGKSEVARYFEKKGFAVIYEDQVGHDALKEPAIRSQLLRLFGDTIVDTQAEIDRKKLATIVFQDAKKLAQLNETIHPIMIQRTQEKFTEYEKAGHSLVFLEAAILFEMGLDRVVDRILYVYATRAVRVSRLTESRKLSLQEAKKRIRSQKIAENKKRSDYVLRNNSAKEELYNACERTLRRLMTLSK